MKSKTEIDRLAQDLCDNDRLIEAAWLMLTSTQPPPPSVNACHVEALKTCYFLGADFVMQVLATAAYEDWSSEDIDNNLAKILKELRIFMHARARTAAQKLDANLH
jgi:hypothetical protein